MQITMTVKQLIDAGAQPDCEGIAAFRAVFGADSAMVEWTRDKQLELMRSPLGKYLFFSWYWGLIPIWSMESADLRSADLRSANLRSANLRSANLSSANLSSAGV